MVKKCINVSSNEVINSLCVHICTGVPDGVHPVPGDAGGPGRYQEAPGLHLHQP